MSKDVARYIYDLVKNDQSDEQLMFKDLYKRRYDTNDDKLISQIKYKIKQIMLDGATSLNLEDYILINQNAMITINNENEIIPECRKYTYKIDAGAKCDQTVYIMDQKTQKVIDEIAIPLDLKVSFECTGMYYYYDMILSWYHWDNK